MLILQLLILIYYQIKKIHPKKTNTNVLVDLAPKPSNTTKTIDVKAWDNLMRQNLNKPHINPNKG